MELLAGLDAAEIRSRLASTDLFREFESGRIMADDFAGRVMKVIGFECGLTEFSEIWSSIFLPETLVPELLITRLKRSYRLLIVSNTNALHFEMLRKTYPIFSHFDDYVLSYEVRAMKPDPEFYSAALARAGCLPGECLFIDDLKENVDGALLAGFDAIQFDSLARLEKELDRRGIRRD
jgi:putative hydrolase of the HAD superfamily